MKLVLDALVVGWLALVLPAQDVAAKLAELDGARGARLEQLVAELTKLGRPAGDAALAPNFAELALARICARCSVRRGWVRSASKSVRRRSRWRRSVGPRRTRVRVR